MQLAFATAAASEVGRAGTLSTSYPSLEALAAAGGALEGVGTSGGGEVSAQADDSFPSGVSHPLGTRLLPSLQCHAAYRRTKGLSCGVACSKDPSLWF